MLAWGKSVSKPFRDRVLEIGVNLAIDPSYLMACIAFESARTFSASIVNAAGSGAVGLIQFMPPTAQALGTTTKKLSTMSAVAQLDYVEKYFAPQKNKLKTLPDVYMAILWPAAVGKPGSFVLFDRSDQANPKRYVQNAGLDYNKDGLITKDEASRRVAEVLQIGLQPDNASN
ncbi:lytic transglycosylase [Pseudolysobacter antarcticus]|uniref:Lytic transglycosylase n=1 Tax=Pseudolysobacter antarcticus TaxID=2511995 RepID=A0A411HG92_9GAMM|nr:transglycosylase SLT domain-containing protein [Pseudolysobacter antarcticus]QBB69460.1 lytic transglycosylase [Pseudolysobacter antarcticus]